jgi:predicted Zn-dependent protease
MESKVFDAMYFEYSGSEGTKVSLSISDGNLSFQDSENKSFQTWNAGEWHRQAVPGSIGKWYLRKHNTAFPVLLLEKDIPDISGTGKKPFRLPPIMLPGIGVFAFFTAVLAAIVLMFWFGLPYLADRTAVYLPTEWEVSLGKEIRQQTLSSLGEDKNKSKLLRKLLAGYQFRQDESSGFQSEFYVVENMEFNAFAIPGGCIFVHTGALEKLRSTAELMALIGHENGHVQGRHSLRTLARSLGLYGLISFFLGDLSGVAAILLDNARSLQTLSYSRDFEREADAAAFEFLCRNGISTQALPSLMETMQKETASGEKVLPAFLSSHPLTEERLQNSWQLVREKSCNSLPENPEKEALFLQLKNQ